MNLSACARSSHARLPKAHNPCFRGLSRSPAGASGTIAVSGPVSSSGAGETPPRAAAYESTYEPQEVLVTIEDPLHIEELAIPAIPEEEWRPQRIGTRWTSNAGIRRLCNRNTGGSGPSRRGATVRRTASNKPISCCARWRNVQLCVATIRRPHTGRQKSIWHAGRLRLTTET
jgi:hypothetical protein